jgi:hypothetical protein
MTEQQKAKVLDFLKQAREEAMDGTSSEEKSAIFKKYKGRSTITSSPRASTRRRRGRVGEEAQTGETTGDESGRRLSSEEINENQTWYCRRRFWLALRCSVPVQEAQYPQIPSDVKQQSDAAKAAADKHSDEMFAKALPVIKAWEAKGKPYIPWARQPSDLPQAGIRAFPGAEGGGAWSFGGARRKVYVVTSLEDDGPGTFREALEAGGPRIVVFNVAGIIKLKSRIRIRAPTSPSPATPRLATASASPATRLSSRTHDVLIRHMRFRRGNTWVGDRNDSLGGNPVGNIMVDHVSGSWGSDE